ncbi:MAG TPA: Holliday junction resolvase RuvX [Patescibacteria group bacterium]|nr:Holliday junction resolvase RuvX [Patescibacteria group bacterium]
MNNQDPIYYLGIDWGEKRIGLAIGDSHTKLALPLTTVASLAEIYPLILKEEINYIILGSPIKMSGEEASGKKWQDFSRSLNEKAGVPVILQDERLSSKAVDALVGQKKDKVARDEMAAALILQSYFDSQNKL